jgi:hypothetical protein
LRAGDLKRRGEAADFDGGKLAWRLSPMNMRLVVAGAVIVIAVVGGYLILPREAGTSTAQPTPTSSPSPTPKPNEVTGESVLPAGRYVLRPYKTTAPNLEIAFTLPDGWNVVGDFSPGAGNPGPPAGSGFAFLSTNSLFSDPCHWNTTDADRATEGDVAVGPTAADLANAIAAQTAYTSTAPVDVSLGGYSGKRLDIQLPDEIDFATECDKELGSSTGTYWMWTPTGDGNNLWADPGERRRLNIVDVDGLRLVIMAWDYAGTSEADKAAVQAVIDSIEITP